MVVRMTYAADGQRRRGRPPRISRDHIVDAACELGIQNLTMAGVAERLGVTHQSLYGWLQDRDELIDLVSDRLVRRIEIRSEEGGGSSAYDWSVPPEIPEDAWAEGEEFSLSGGDHDLAIARANKFRAVVSRYFESIHRFPMAFERSFSGPNASAISSRRS